MSRREPETHTGRYPELAGRVAVITGAAKGIGRGIAERMVDEGMSLVAADIDGDTLDATVEALGGSRVHGFTGDLSVDAEVDRLFAETVERFGTVDLLVNNAADLRRGRLLDDHTDVLDIQLSTNIRSPYLCSQAAAAIMRDHGGGSIVHISSVGALRAHHRGFPYDVTKGAINTMTLAMAVDLGEYGIRVNAIGPGVTVKGDRPVDETQRRITEERIPLRRSGTVDDIAAMVAFLASEESSYVTGQIIYVDGGITAQLSPPGSGALEADGRRIQPGERNQTS
jgi:3-oxoacyl-[acyl-carrier protein] reductase